VTQPKIIVIGASQGGVDALIAIAAKLQPDLNAAVFVVLHIGSSSRSRLPELLGRVGPLLASWARHAELIEPGRIYIAPPDRHMLLAAGYVRVVHGAKENHTRPVVDPLFRPAALAYGPAVIGVVRTGNLDNGTAGLLAIKDFGGVAVVQEPDEAEAPSMPASALRHVPIDYRLSIEEIGPLLVSLSANGSADPLPDPPTPRRELIAGESEFADPATAPQAEEQIDCLGIPSDLACPECGGVLFQIRDERVLRYRCKLGHGLSGKTLLRDLAAAREDALWSALRAINEEADLARRLAEDAERNEDCQTAAFLGALADRTALQAIHLREAIAAASDLIEPDAPRRLDLPGSDRTPAGPRRTVLLLFLNVPLCGCRSVLRGGRPGRRRAALGQLAQMRAGAGEPRSYRPNRNSQQCSGIAIGLALQGNPQHQLPLFIGQFLQGILDFAQSIRHFGVGTRHYRRFDAGAAAAGLQPSLLAGAAPHLADELVVQNGAEPSAQIGPLLPQMLTRECAQQTALHEILGASGVAGQRPGVAPQGGQLGRKQTADLSHVVLARFRHCCSRDARSGAQRVCALEAL
jgi:two-component system, chemotaxis family, protein-glutamate methylesterase/glutaminase